MRYFIKEQIKNEIKILSEKLHLKTKEAIENLSDEDVYHILNGKNIKESLKDLLS